MQQTRIEEASDYIAKNFGEESSEDINNTDSERGAGAPECDVHRSVCISKTGWTGRQGPFQDLYGRYGSDAPYMARALVDYSDVHQLGEGPSGNEVMHLCR